VIGPRRVEEVGWKSRFFGWGRVTDWLIVAVAQPEDPGTRVSEILLLGTDGLNVGPCAPAVAMNLVDIGQDRLEVDLALVLEGIEPRGTVRRFRIGCEPIVELELLDPVGLRQRCHAATSLDCRIGAIIGQKAVASS